MNNGISIYYTSNERDYFSISADISNSENKYRSKKIYTEMYFFYFYFSIVHISSNDVYGSLKFCMHVGNIYAEGTLSQIVFKTPSFYFMSKNG